MAQTSLSPPQFTIVIPTKDEAGYIGRSLSSHRASRAIHDLPLDIVVVDRGSADSTTAEASGLADIVIATDPIVTPTIGSARNVGAKATSSEFIFHTDADVVVPRLDTLLREALIEFSDPTVVAVTTPVEPYPWNSTRTDRVFHRLANEYLEFMLYHGALFSRGECQIVRRSAFDEVGGYSAALTSGEDCDLFHRLSQLGRISYRRDLCVYHSVRRFRAWGYGRTVAVYSREALWTRLFGRCFLTSWPVVR